MSHEAAKSVGPGPATREALPAAADAADLKNARKAVVAAAIGNGLEWFDLIVYGTFAVTISKLFFPPPIKPPRCC